MVWPVAIAYMFSYEPFLLLGELGFESQLSQSPVLTIRSSIAYKTQVIKVEYQVNKLMRAKNKNNNLYTGQTYNQFHVINYKSASYQTGRWLAYSAFHRFQEIIYAPLLDGETVYTLQATVVRYFVPLPKYRTTACSKMLQFVLYPVRVHR